MEIVQVLLLLMLLFKSQSLLPISTAIFRRGKSRARSVSTTIRMASKTDETQLLTGMRNIVDHYDTFLLDMWGVMHDGGRAYEGVIEVVRKLKEEGKDMVILSNSSKRRDNSVKMLTKLGFDPDNDFSQIITSGEVTYQLLTRAAPEASPLAPKPWDVLDSILSSNREPAKVFCFGSGDKDEEYLESCGWKLSSMETADVIVARGTFTIMDGFSVVDKIDDGKEAYFKAYHEQLSKAAERSLPMIVSNPDKIRPDADRSPMPGTIGSDYEGALKRRDISMDTESVVKYIGKPFVDVFEIALRGKNRSRVCMIGDALETDVTGGSTLGIDTIWVVSDGIHNEDIERKGNGSLEVGCSAVLDEFNQRSSDTYAKGRQVSPNLILPHFRW